MLAWAGATACGLTSASIASQEPAASRVSAPVVVASKPFGESYLLAEVFAQLLESRGIVVRRQPGLGATEIAYSALRRDAIDVYPEYTGTALLAILGDTLTPAMRRDPRATYAHVARTSFARDGVRWLAPLGFQNGYAIAVRRTTAEQLGVRTLSDLARAGGGLVGGLTADFIGRSDGLPGLAAAYRLRFKSVRPLAPSLKYGALASGAVDVIDGYTTDGFLAAQDLVTLEDDRRFFPPYEAAAVVSPRVASSRPDVITLLALLSDRLTEEQMRAYNHRVEVRKEPISAVAAALLHDLGLTSRVASAPAAANTPESSSLAAYAWARRSETAAQTVRHLQLVVAALFAAVLIAVPLGLLLEGRGRTAAWTLGGLGVLQTMPSLALLAFMVPVLGVGVRPALVALWLYALYPIARSTYAGLRAADPEAVAACEAMGATPWQRLLWVRLPLAAPVILAGVRTSAVITVGAATLAAFVGAGGLGDPIVTGLALADMRLVLAGAVPAALLALAVDGLLALVERVVRPAHLRSDGHEWSALVVRSGG